MTFSCKCDIIKVTLNGGAFLFRKEFKGDIKMIQFKIFFKYTLFWILFALCFAVMFVFLVAAVMGITSGVMLAVLGTAIIMFKASFIISELAPELMLFGGLCGAFFTAFLGAAAIKIGFLISRLFIRVKRQCDKLRDSVNNISIVPAADDEQINEEIIHNTSPAPEADDEQLDGQNDL